MIYVPVFRHQNDETALQVYRDAGFSNVVPIDSRILSNQGAGSLHCITMTYPPVEMDQLLHRMGGFVLL